MFGIAPYLRADLIDPAATAQGNLVPIVAAVVVAALLLFFVLRGRK